MSLKVDLKSQETRRGISFDYGWIFVFVFIIVAFVAYYIAGLRLQSAVEQRKQELQSWKDKVAGFSGIQGKLDQLKGEIGSLQAQITHMRELRFDPLRYSILLVRLSKLLPTNLWIGSLAIDPTQNSLTLAGSAVQQAGNPPLASLAAFLRNLQNDKDNYFSDIVLQGTTSTGKTGNLWTFNLTAKYNVPLIHPNPAPPPVSVPVVPPANPSAAPPIAVPPMPEKPPMPATRSRGMTPPAVFPAPTAPASPAVSPAPPHRRMTSMPKQGGQSK